MGSGSSARVKALDSKETETTSVMNGSSKASTQKCENLSESLNNNNTSLPVTETPHSSFITPLQILPSSQSNNKSSAAMANAENLSVTQTHLEIKIAQLEKELGSSESEKLDLLDQLQALEERLKELTTLAGEKRENPEVPGPAQLSETLRAKDHFIQQLEQQVASLQTDFNRTRARMRKKIRSLTNQLCEAKQESSISKLELRESNAELKEELKHCHGDLAFASSTAVAEAGTDSRTTIILELSAQVSEQAAMIAELEEQLKVRDQELHQLRRKKQKSALTSATAAAGEGSAERVRGVGGGDFQAQAPARMDMGRGGIPLPDPRFGALRAQPSSGSSGSSSAKLAQPSQNVGASVVAAATSGHGGGISMPRSEGSDTDLPSLQHRQPSTALSDSDSDSDWEVETTPTAAKIHSAPPRFRSQSPAVDDDDLNENNININNNNNSYSSDGSRPGLLSADEGGALQSRPASSSHSRQKRRSVLRGRLGRQGPPQTRSGPSLAFVHPLEERMQDGSSDKAVSDLRPHKTASGLRVASTVVARPLAVCE